MRDLFTPPVFADEEKTHTARLLYVMLLITLASTLLFAVSLALFVPRNFLAQVPNTLVIAAVCITIFFLVRRGFTRAAGCLLISLVWIQSLVQAFLTGGIASPNFASHVAIIVGTGLLLGARAGAVTMGLSLAAGYGLVRLEQAHWLPATLAPPTAVAWWLSYVAIFAVVVILQWLAARTIRDALARARASEAQYRMLFEEAPDGICIADADNRVLMINPALQQLLGYTLAEVYGRPATDFIAPESLAERPAATAAHLRAQGSQQRERLLLKKDGARVPVATSIRPMPDGRFHYILRDVTERQQVEAALRESEALYRRAIEAAGAVPYFLDYATETYQFMGEGILALTGYRPEEITLARWRTLVQDYQLLGAAAPYAAPDAVRRMRAGEITTWESDELIRARDGRLRWVQDTSVQVRNDQNQPRGSIGILQDITARKQAEAALAEQAAELRTLYQLSARLAEAATDIQVLAQRIADVVVHDLKFVECGLWLITSDAAALRRHAYSGYAPDYIVFDIALDGKGLMVAAVQTGETIYAPEVQLDPRYLAGDANTRSELVAPLRARGRIIGVLNVESPEPAAFTDHARQLLATFAEHAALALDNAQLVVSLGQAVAEVQNLNADLEGRVTQRTAALQQRTTQLEEANKELESFSYTISHDLRAPLRAVDGFSKILLTDYAPDLPAEAQRYLNHVREGAQRMSQLIDDLLAFARLGRQTLHLQTLTSDDVTALVQAAVTRLRAETPDRVLVVHVADLPACQADPALLKQVFINLLSNAVKFSQPRAETQIEIGCVPSANGPALYVRDNGAGFDMRYAHKLFGVFQRLHPAEEFEGTGVGLAVVQRIIERHGGRVWAEAKPDQGATFYFTLSVNH